MLKIEDRFLPITLSLLAVEDYFFGIKVTLFDLLTVSDTGFFLTVNKASWERKQEEKQAIKVKDKLHREYSLIDHLKATGFKYICEQM